MAQTKLGKVDLTATGPVVIGSITITFLDADGHLIPEVSFAPLGRINPNTIERYLPFIYREIQRAQVKERRGE